MKLIKFARNKHSEKNKKKIVLINQAKDMNYIYV